MLVIQQKDNAPCAPARQNPCTAMAHGMAHAIAHTFHAFVKRLWCGAAAGNQPCHDSVATPPPRYDPIAARATALLFVVAVIFFYLPGVATRFVSHYLFS